MEVFYENKRKYNCIVHGTPYFRKTVTIAGKRRSFYGDGEKDCLDKIEEAKINANMGLNLDYRLAKVGPTMKRWLFEVKRMDRDLKASTFTRYESAFRVQFEPYPIASLPLSKLDSIAMQSYLNSMYEEHGVSGASIKETVKVVKMFCAWAVNEGYLKKNPCLNITLPGRREKGKKVIEVFTAEERTKIAKAMKDMTFWYDTLINLAFATGMRQGELLALRWDDIYDGAIHVERSTALVTHVNKDGSFDRYREVWDTKTENSVRTIPILESTEQMLRQHHIDQTEYMLENGLGRTDYVFTDTQGGIIDACNLRKAYIKMLKFAGVPYRKFHAIRHTFATEAIRRGIDVKDLQLLLGHSDVQTTYIYVQSDDNSKRSAIEKMGAII